MSAISKFFAQDIQSNTFRRVDKSHPLDLYLGKDVYGNIALLLITDEEPPLARPSRLIHVVRGLREDGKWAMSFVLDDSAFIDLFCGFCEDIIEASRLLSEKKNGAKFIVRRYLKWQEMLKKAPNAILSPEEIKGLIGELHFLKYFLIEEVGEQVAIDSWIGPAMADQDFVCPNCWYEIKALSSGATTVEISSIEQLDVESEGELVTIYLDKTSKTNCNGITLNSIIDEITSAISDNLLKIKFKDILLDFGYVRTDEYDEYPYVFTKMTRYKVTKIFPAIRKESLSGAIVSAKYRISLASINTFVKG